MRQNPVLKQPPIGHPGPRADKEPGLAYEPHAPYVEKQASRDLEQPAYRYDSTGYADALPRNLDHRLRYEEPWAYGDDKQPYQVRATFDSQHPRDLDPRQHAEEPSERAYFPRFEEPAPLSYDSRPRYEQPLRTSTLRHEEPVAPGYDVHTRYRPEMQPYTSAGPKAAEPRQYYEQYPRGYEQGFPPKAGHYEPLPGTIPPLTPAAQQKPEVLPPTNKPLPPPPTLTEEEEEDPAMKPQSVLTRVKMFENKRSASLENRKDENHTAAFKVSVSFECTGTLSEEQFTHSLALPYPQPHAACFVIVCSWGMCVFSLQPPEVASKPPGAPITGPKATPQSQFSDHDKTLYRWVPLWPLWQGTD